METLESLAEQYTDDGGIMSLDEDGYGYQSTSQSTSITGFDTMSFLALAKSSSSVSLAVDNEIRNNFCQANQMD